MKKHAFPWERPVNKFAGFHAGMTSDEFIAWLRYRAIDDGAPQQLVDMLDELGPRSEDEVNELVEEAKECMHTECCNAVVAVAEKLNLTTEQIKELTNTLENCKW